MHREGLDKKRRKLIQHILFLRNTLRMFSFLVEDLMSYINYFCYFIMLLLQA